MSQADNQNHLDENENSAKFSNDVEIDEDHSSVEDNENDLEDVEGTAYTFG